MKKQELMYRAQKVIQNKYWNGISIDHDSGIFNDKVILYFNFLIPKRVYDEESNTLNTYFLILKDVGSIELQNNGKIIDYSDENEVVINSLERYKELYKKREIFIIRILAEKLIKLPAVHITLTPLRIVLDAFYSKDFLIDSISKNFDTKERKYIKFLLEYDYLRIDNNKYTLHNEYIKKLKNRIDVDDKKQVIDIILTDVFKNSFQYLIQDLRLTNIVPFIGIVTSFYNLALDLNKNVSLPIDYLYEEYKTNYACGINKLKFQDKLKDLAKLDILDVNQQVIGNNDVVNLLLKNSGYKSIQAQLA